ncbi:MAG: DUF1844 domain-containing protein [Acidimicrobiales bacterium]|jgi:hypothetical protein|nr:DUF1844 domain-containing protein [Acidimicrobiales bacterium]
MSSLWTPGGEHPIDRSAQADAPTEAPATDPTLDDEIAAALPEGVKLSDLSPEERARAEEMVREMAEARERLIQTPAAMVVANHGMGLYELAALHLSQETPNFTEASVAIDGLVAIVEKLEGRLGDAEATLVEALDQLRMVFVQLKNPGSVPAE